jgi:hypothetical protein
MRGYQDNQQYHSVEVGFGTEFVRPLSMLMGMTLEWFQ